MLLRNPLRASSTGSKVAATPARVRPAPILRHPSERDWPVEMPVASIGECRRSVHCGQYLVDLADGLCLWHWDRAVSSKPPGCDRGVIR